MICLCATFPLIELPEIEEEMYEYVINQKDWLVVICSYLCEKYDILFSKILQRYACRMLDCE